MKNRQKNSGFTLIEIAIVLLIVSIILGYTVAMFPIQQELKQYRQAEQEMDKIIDSLYAFAQVNGYLPCPAWFVPGVPAAGGLPAVPAITSNGFECRDINNAPTFCVDGGAVANPNLHSCDIWFGFVPGKTLGIDGRYSQASDLLLDPWGQAYRYQVTNTNTGGGVGPPPASPNPDFITPGDIRAEANLAGGGLSALGADLVICNADPTPLAAGANDISCANPAQTIFGAAATPCTNANQQCAPVVILSTGKDATTITSQSLVQLENQDNNVNDRVFIKTLRNDAVDAGTNYDDLVKWVSPNILYSKMIDAGQLP